MLSLARVDRHAVIPLVGVIQQTPTATDRLSYKLGRCLYVYAVGRRRIIITGCSCRLFRDTHIIREAGGLL